MATRAEAIAAGKAKAAAIKSRAKPVTATSAAGRSLAMKTPQPYYQAPANTSGRAPIQKTMVIGANPGGSITRADAMSDLRTSASAGGRTLDVNGVIVPDIRFQQAPTDGAISGADKLAKYKTAGLHKAPALRSPNMAIGAAGGAFGYSKDPATQAELDTRSRTETPETQKYRFDPRGAGDGTPESQFGVSNRAQVESDAFMKKAKNVQSKFEETVGANDIQLIYSYDAEGNPVSVVGYKGTTGDPELDKVRFQRYSEDFGNAKGETGISQEDTYHKYASQEEEIMRRSLGDLDLRQIDDRHSLDLQQGQRDVTQQYAGLAGISGVDAPSESISSLERTTALANEQRTRETDRLDSIRDQEIARIDSEKKKAEGDLKKRITAEEKKELERLISSGYLQTTGKGKELLSSQALRQTLSSDFQTQLDDGMAEINDQYESGRRQILVDHEMSMGEVDSNYFSTLKDVEAERIKLDQESLDRRVEAMQAMETEQISYADTLAEFKKLTQGSPEMVDALASTLRSDLISLGITDPNMLSNIVESIKTEAERSVRAETALTEQRERASIPTAPKPKKLSAPAENAIRSVGNDVDSLRAINLIEDEEDRAAALRSAETTEAGLREAINYLSSGEGGVISQPGITEGFTEDEMVEMSAAGLSSDMFESL